MSLRHIKLPIRGRQRAAPRNSDLGGGALTVTSSVEVHPSNGSLLNGGSVASLADLHSVSLGDIDKDTIRIGELLIERNLVTESQVAKALSLQRESGGLFGQTLVGMGVLGERTLADALAWKFDMPECDLRTQVPERQAVTLLPEEIAKARSVIPVTLNGNDLFVAVVEPSEDLRRLLAETTGCNVHMMIATLSSVREAIEASYTTLGGVAQLFEDLESNRADHRRTTVVVDPQFINDESPVTDFVDGLLAQALRDRASEIHLEPQDRSMRIRCRIDGVMKEVHTVPSAFGQGVVNRLKTIAQMNVVEKRRPQDGRFTAIIEALPIDVRVATISTVFGETCVLRILDRSKSVIPLDRLGLAPDVLDAYAELIRLPFGMVVCAGPAGSGKTTTLYSTLSELDDPSTNIMTVEDPVEFVSPTINQIETNEDAGVTFVTGLKSILRQAPDVILVGDIRDAETARIAIGSATNHLVFCSLSAIDSVAALGRFPEMGVEPFLIAASVTGIISQRLVRRICEQCKTTYTPTPEERAFYEQFGDPGKTSFLRGSGCAACSQTGYKDRIGVFELLPVTPTIKQLVVSGGTDEEIRLAASQQGVLSLREQATRLVTQDLTTVSEIARNVTTAY